MNLYVQDQGIQNTINLILKIASLVCWCRASVDFQILHIDLAAGPGHRMQCWYIKPEAGI